MLPHILREASILFCMNSFHFNALLHIHNYLLTITANSSIIYSKQNQILPIILITFINSFHKSTTVQVLSAMQKGKRESGENPERSGHCKRLSVRIRPLPKGEKARFERIRKPGNLLGWNDKYLPQKVAYLRSYTGKLYPLGYYTLLAVI